MVFFAVMFVSLCVFERIMNVLFILFTSERGNKQRFAGQVVGGVFWTLGQVCTGVFYVVFQVLAYFAQRGLALIFLLCVFALINYVWARHAGVVFGLVGYYNARVGPFFYQYVLLPLRMASLVFKGVYPVVNSVVWVFRVLGSQVWFPMLLDQIALVGDLATGLFGFCSGLAFSLIGFFEGLSCRDGRCLTEVSELELVSVGGSVRDLYVVGTRMLTVVCPIMTVPLDLVFYPLLDVNLAECVHNLVNAALYLFVHLPIVTYQRCRQFGSHGGATDILMCTPDIAPVVSRLASGLRDMGALLDNWMAVALSTVIRALTRHASDCLPSDRLDPETFRGNVLSGEQTTVGLTDWLMATTNGTIAVFYGQRSTDSAPRRWPGEISPRYGVAAVSYGDVNDVDVSLLTQARRPGSRQSTTLMGCGCTDRADGLALRCYLLPYSSALDASAAQFDVLFQDRVWARTLTCSTVEVTVRSVRWQVRRGESLSVAFGPGTLDLPTQDCVTKGSCESVDATVWVVPRCDLLPGELCSDVAVGTSCFPFCMAARVAGSGNASPILVNAAGWRGGKQMMRRDCTDPASSAASGSVAGLAGQRTLTSFYGATTLSGVAASPQLLSSGGQGAGCRNVDNGLSWVSKAGSEEHLAYTRAVGQPFAITGDTILLDDPQEDGGTLVMVERLTGDQRDVYTLRRAYNHLPAAPKRIVPMEELGQNVKGAVVVPLEYAATRVLATNTKNYVFYAANPDLRVFEAYLDYCADPAALPRFQFMATSSYGPLRVYRLRAYCQTSCDQDLSAQFTFTGLEGADGFGESSFPRDCSRVYNASIVGLEYVNDQNLAVTVQVADRTYNASLGRGSGSTYSTYWLNPHTMRVRVDQPWPLEIPALSAVDACEGRPSVPHLGTMVMEGGIAMIHMGAAVVGGVLNFPGVIKMWHELDGLCPLQSQGHSAVASCGAGLFDLSDYFDSLDDATAIFWGITGFFSDSLTAVSPHLSVSPVANILNGMGLYGRATVDILDARQKGLLSIMNTPLPQQVETVWGLISRGGLSRGAAGFAVSGLTYGRYGTLAVTHFVHRVLSRGVSGGAGGLFTLLTESMYETRPVMASTVGQRAHDACLGIQTMMGGDNPWGSMLYHLCRSSAGLPSGVLDLFLLMFVDVPVVKCVCKDSQGHKMDAYVMKHCVPGAPPGLRPTLLGMIAAARQQDKPELLCPAVIAYTRGALKKTMDPYFSSMDRMMGALGDSLDYALVGLDASAGQCENFAQDPQVVVIMPQPIAYFQACGMTSSCQSKCSGPWRAFSEALALFDPASLRTSRVIQQTTESLFFPTPGVDIVANGRVVAILQLQACGAAACREGLHDCIAVAMLGSTSIFVEHFCVPMDPAASVHPMLITDSNWQSTIGANALQVAFYGPSGSALLVLVPKDNGNVVHLLSPKAPPAELLGVAQGIPTLLLMGLYPLNVVSFRVIGDHVMAGVAVRKTVNGGFQSSISYVWFTPGVSTVNTLIGVVDFPENVLSGYAASEYPSEPSGDSAMRQTVLLLWPTQASGGPLRLTVQYSNQTLRVVSLEPYQFDQSLVAKASFMPRSVILAQGLRVVGGALEVYASTGSQYDWLQMLRVTGSDLVLQAATLRNSRPVQAQISVQTGCDGTDCRGCTDLKLRALCSQYQQCSVVRCIGTAVNLKRPLCGIGGVLSGTGQMTLEMTRGGWLVFVDVFMVLLELSTRQDVREVTLSSPQDAFFGKICAAKDLSAEFSGVIMSTVNSALQLAQVPVPILQDTAKLDSNANTILSLTTAALTSFFHQVGLLPIYMLAVSHKIMMCQIQGYVSLLSTVGFSINLVPANLLSASDGVSGQCLAQSTQVDVLQTGDAASKRSAGARVATLLTGAGQQEVMRRLDPLIHMFDGTLTYLIGVLGSFAGVLQTMDLQNCVVPDVTLQYAMQCACGDQAMAISAQRRAEGVAKYAYWCSGTVSVIDAQNKVRVVYNPHSYQELQTLIGDLLDQYLKCTASSNSCTPPNLPVFQKQGVNAIQVLTRCRQNYVNQQWDQAAYVQYDARALAGVRGGVQPPVLDGRAGVGACLLASAAKGGTNGACLDDYLRELGQDSRYWAYEQLASNSSVLIDACMVFTGPANRSLGRPEVTELFRDCLRIYSDGDGERGCDLSGYMWSPSSSNTVPVAQLHVVGASSGMIETSVAKRMQMAHDIVIDAVKPLLEYDNPELRADFFSSEGDVIHQLLDCVFMGPYARMDYWPTPLCNESQTDSCLVGPYWSRDEGRGASRGVDILSCQATPTLPFTCGSPSRKGMVREFVKVYVEQGRSGTEVFVRLIREWLNHTFYQWQDYTSYGCDCPPGSAARNSPSCCNGTADVYLPDRLHEGTLQLPSSSVLNALEQRMQAFYDDALNDGSAWTNWLTAEESAKYDSWTHAARDRQIRTEALFDADKATMGYSSAEAMRPPNKTGGGWLWDQCHGALRQVFFTLPVNSDGSLRHAPAAFNGGGVEAISAYVQEATRAAFEDSPLYRHYQVRHHPSNSTVCRQRSVDPPGGRILFGDYTVASIQMAVGAGYLPVSSLGFQAGYLGRGNYTCFCGWKLHDDRCIVPESICPLVKQLTGASACYFPVDSQPIATLSDAYQPKAWPCPYLDLTDHLGFLDPSQIDAWVSGKVDLTTSIEHVLRYGPGGLKAGNIPRASPVNTSVTSIPLADLREVLRLYMSPRARAVDPARAVLEGCEESTRLQGLSLVDDFVERLFPMAQGVEESGVGAYCLRFAIELSRLRALELFQSENHVERTRQKEIVLEWRRKCGTQARLIGMCQALQVYRPIGVGMHTCPQHSLWQIVPEHGHVMYVTPQCLVHVDGVFYDPCTCNPHWCTRRDNGIVRLTRSMLQAERCGLRFDPRSVVTPTEMGRWGRDDARPGAQEWNAWQAEGWNLLDLDGLTAGMMEQGQAAGNTPPGQHWATSEGFMNETGLFCDMISDYWPDESLFPVGYHVSVPCDGSETGYRSFDNVFALDLDQASPRLVYLEDETRDRGRVDSHLGASGICRLTNFGFDMYETNTMRACTRVHDNEDVDIHVPKTDNPPGELGMDRCSASSEDLPWDDTRLFTVGTVPSLPTPSDVRYPSDPAMMMRLGPQGRLSREGWGSSCQDFAIPNCSAGWKCPAGFRCMEGGVCQDQGVHCVQHGDCAAGAMCTGMGRCTRPRVTMINRMDRNMSFMAHTSACSGEAFSMRGVSAWGYVPDLLHTHGMCSYRHWQEYLYTRSSCKCTGSSPCTVDGQSCSFVAFDEPNNNNMWWDPANHFPNRLKMLPTTCDRDYQRFSVNGAEMKGCAAGQGRYRLVGPGQNVLGVAQRDQAWRTYDQDTRRVSMATMPFFNNPSYGFLGFQNDPKIQSCTRIQQCFCDTHTRNGRPSMYLDKILRPNRTSLLNKMYEPNDIFQCGAIGYLDQGRCKLDTRVAPLYQLLCQPNKAVSAACAPVLKTNIQQLCRAVDVHYEMKYSYIQDVVVPALTALFYAFEPAVSLPQHIQMGKCMSTLYTEIATGPFESKGLYFPFTFTLYELPFAWFYQCMVQGGVSPTQDLTRVLYKCSNYEKPSTHALGVYSRSDESFASFVSNVRGFYDETTVRRQVTAQYTRASQVWGRCVDSTREKHYGNVDRSHPVCYTEKRWRLDTGDYHINRAIETYVRPTCASNIRISMLKNINEKGSLNIDIVDLVDYLTTKGGGLVAQSPETRQNPILSDKIYNFGLGVLQKKTLLENLNTRPTGSDAMPVVYDASLPGVRDTEYRNARDQLWKRLYEPNPKDVYTRPPPNEDCTAPSYLYTSNGNPDSASDTDFLNLGTYVKVCPVYGTGLFGCQLDTIKDDKGVSYTYTGRDEEAAYEAYVDVLYNDTLTCYNREMAKAENRPEFLRPNTTFFFEDEASLGFGDSFRFDLTQVSRYIVNIQPDVSMPVMCAASNQVVDYANCTDVNYDALDEHVRRQFTVQTGTIVPPQYQMDWDVTRDMMEAGAIFSFADVERNVSKQYMGFLFERSHTCTGTTLQGKRLAPASKLCMFTSQNLLATGAYVSPWLNGEWNPFDKCDVDTAGPTDGFVETVNIECNFPGYCVKSGGAAFDQATPYYGNMPYYPTCLNKNGFKTTQLNVNPDTPYNLCKHSLIEDSVCLHMQGMLGGTDGFPMEDYSAKADMYSLHDFKAFPSGDGALFGNVLLAGKTSDYGFVRFPSSHIGGHQLVMVLQDNLLRVQYMPLKEVDPNRYLANQKLADVRDWVTVWQEGMQADHVAYVRNVMDAAFVQGYDARGQPHFGWDCPIRRRAFYGGSADGFSPYLPSARRSQRVFGRLTGSRFANPVQRRAKATEFGEYRTSNGFCFCPVSLGIDPTLCAILVNDMEHDCSLFKTIAAVQGLSWGSSHTFQTQGRGTTTAASSGPSRCTLQVDWPFVKGTLRDNQTVTDADVSDAWAQASSSEEQKCHVLDRLTDFEYIFVSKNELRRSGVNTLQGGVCHTGRVQGWQRPRSGARCLRTAKGSRDVNVTCSDGTAYTRVRRRSADPQAQAATRNYGRSMCGRCTPPPRFQTKSGTPMEPESSFGLPFRLSAERVLADDLLKAICAEDAACRSKLNLTAWQAGEFMRAYVRAPATLFQPSALGTLFDESSRLTPRPAPDDTALWADPWVYCPSREALLHGANCTGSIPKSEWRADKVGTCHRAVDFALQGRADPMAKTDVCSLDPKLAAVCRAIQKGRSLVASANCLASGNPRCMLQEFMYTPSTWESTNQEFVHDTVTKFYRLSDPQCLKDITDCVCPVDPRLTAFVEDKQFRLQQCSAVSVVVVQQMLVFIRGLGNQICVAFSYLISMILDTMLTFSTEGFTQGKQQLMLHWAEFKRLAGGVVDGVSDMATDMVFQSGVVGPWMRTRLYMACGAVNQAYKYFSNFWCGFIVTQLPIFLGSLKSVGFWIETGFTVVNDVFQTILRNYLPDAMMDLYERGYDKFFASNEYSEKTSAYEKKKQLDLNNPKQDKALSTQAKNYHSVANQQKVMKNMVLANVKSGAKAAENIRGPVAVAASILSLGLGIYETVDTAERAQQIAALADKFPTSLTLFDFTSFYESIDAIVMYLETDLTCYSVIPGTDAMQCDQLAMPSPRGSDVGRMSPVATSCWADAQQKQVGVSTLYSCGATSTCCADPLCQTTMLCASCPVQTAAGYRDFGCNTVVQRCQCGVQSVVVSRCASHGDCAPSSACSLLTSLEDVSFGTLAKCSLCSVQPVCLMGKSPQSGACTCLTTGDLEVDRCAGAGTVVQPHASNLCGFSRESSFYHTWKELALALCANVNSPVCSEVTTEGNGLMYMPVATSLRGLGFSSRRRLLATDDPEEEEPRFPAAFTAQAPSEDIAPGVLHAFLTNASWNQTAAPCSTLAHAYNKGEHLGPLDEAALQSCVYWRRVGRLLIQEFNLTSLQDADNFLMSPDDLAWALGRAGVAEELSRQPWVWVSAAMYSPWLKPARAWYRALHGPNVSRMVRGFMQGRGGRAEQVQAWVQEEAEGEAQDQAEGEAPEPQTEGEDTRAPDDAGAPHRRLLGLFKETDDRLQRLPFYAYVRRLNQSIVPLSTLAGLAQLAGPSWLRGAFSWRPFDFGAQCAPADMVVASTTQVLGVLRTYYTRFEELNRDRKVTTRLGDSLPTFSMPGASYQDEDARLEGTRFWTFQGMGAYVLNTALSVTGVRLGDVVRFLNDPCDGGSCVDSNRWTLTRIMESVTFCDYESLMYCSNYRRSLVVSFLMAVLVYWGLSVVLGMAGADFVTPWLFYGIPVMTLWLSMGVSFTCLPMLPTCLLDDLVLGLEELVPLKSSIPPALIVGNNTALRSCDGLGFGGWTDSLAFLLCDAGLCGTGSHFLIPDYLFIDWDSKRGMLASRDVDAYRWCAFLSMGNALWIFLLAPLLYGVVYAAAYCVTMLVPQTLSLIWYVVAYNHET